MKDAALYLATDIMELRVLKHVKYLDYLCIYIMRYCNSHFFKMTEVSIVILKCCYHCLHYCIGALKPVGQKLSTYATTNYVATQLNSSMYIALVYHYHFCLVKRVSSTGLRLLKTMSSKNLMLQFKEYDY